MGIAHSNNPESTDKVSADVLGQETQPEHQTEPPEDEFGEHAYLLKYWKKMSPTERRRLLEQFEELDLSNAMKAFYASITKQEFAALEPITEGRHVVARDVPAETLAKFRAKGLEYISQGKVAALVLAGGQATRLGATQPKGIIPLGLGSACNTLFAIQACRIARLQTLARECYPGSRCIIPWYVMTSKQTFGETSDYLEENVADFGLKMENVHIFKQGQMPCFDLTGKLILSSKEKIAMAPNGNGGIYAALKPHLKSMREQGIEYVHVYCVDNILCRVADPIFIGFCALRNIDCAAKVVEKTDPDEDVGLFCKQEGKIKLAEYSEIPDDLKNKRNSSNLLEYRAANIANHVFSMDFLDKICSGDYHLPYHRALKKIPFFDGEKLVKPTAPNGIKLELFITDAFQYANNFYLWEVVRSAEFSPLKNAEFVGKDCLGTCMRDLCMESKRWLLESGAVIHGNAGVFVHPLRSYEGENLKEYEGTVVKTPCVIGLHE